MPRLGVTWIGRLAIGVVLIALGVIQPSWVEVNAAGESWYNDSWQLRKAITIDATKVNSGPHTDFPVLINLTSDASLAANAQADGDDILFTSSGGATKLSHEIEKYTSATGALVAWVKVSSLSSASNTVLYMYYGNASAASQQDATGVWSSGYEAVYHLNENFLDSTSNARTATNNGTADATGRMAQGRDFEVSDTTDRLVLGTWNVSGSNITVQTWVNFESFGTSDARLVSKGQSTAEQDIVFMLSTNLSGADEVLRMRIKTGTNDAANTTTFVATSGALSTGTWYLSAATYDGTNMRLLLNGTDVGSTGKTGSLRENSWAIWGGNQANGADPKVVDGVLDEIRISSATRTPGWITTEYNNQNSPSTFYALGTAENVPVVPPPPEPTPVVTLTISSTSPSDGATDVAIDTTVSATFSMLMNGSTLTTDTFKLSSGGNEVDGSVTTNGATATFTPSANLDYNTIYTARITTGAQAANFGGTTLDNDYTWSFTTTEDADPPTVSSTSPVNGAAGVAINSGITATFSETMQSSTINTNTFTVSDSSGNIGGTVSYSGTTATFTPSGNLSDSTTYTARITTGVMDLNGNAITSDYTWSFATVDTTQPTVSSTSPVNGATGVAINSTITAIFSEAMQSSTINTNTFTVSNGSGNIVGTVSYSGTTATFTPSGNLSDSTTYTARITTGVKDLAGNAMASDYTWSFTTGDFTAPTVISTSPANGATGVAINSTIKATFSDVMDSSTINTNTFTVSNGSGNIVGTVSYSGTTATFTPSGNLSDSTTYTATITTWVMDLGGNAMTADYTWGFTTVDTIPPRVISTIPLNGATGVAINSTITATFSETMQSSTINTNTFTVNDGSGNINGTVSYSGTTATFTPSGNLSDSTTYTAKITTGVKDLTGNAMTSDYTWSFTTGDFTAPTVISTSPVNGATGVAINSVITATFNDVMQSSTINTNTFTVSDGSGNISGMVSYSGTTATFTPSSNLSDSTTYTATITTGVRDLAGNAMASDYTWSFTTVDTTLPIVSSTSPVEGAVGVAINSTITATFSEAMQSSTINTNTFMVSDGSGNIEGIVSYSGTTATFTPSANLDFNTIYTATITTGVKDLAGNAMASAYTWGFTTTDDADPPTVSSTIPPNGAAGVSINSNITATFSEAMQSSTINTNTFTVSDGSGNIGGTVSYSGTTATFTPSSNLSDSTTYTAQITTGVRDSAGNAMASPYTWSFATTAGGADITPPTVNSTIPANGAAEVDVGSTIIATFSEAMQSSTINTDTFTVNDGSGNIGGTVSYSGATATFTPSENLDFNTIYKARITTGAMDLTGNAMAADYTWSFMTISALPTPTITSTPTASPTPTPCVGAIAGQVTEATTGDPIVGVIVAYGTGRKREDIIETTETGVQGIYSFTSVDCGNYVVGVTANGYRRSSTTNVAQVSVEGGEAARADFALQPKAAPTPTPVPCDIATAIDSSPSTVTVKKGNDTKVTVTVTGVNGCAIVGDTVTTATNNVTVASVRNPTSGTTDENGEVEFTIACKAKGTAIITFKDASVTPNITDTTTITVTD